MKRPVPFLPLAFAGVFLAINITGWFLLPGYFREIRATRLHGPVIQETRSAYSHIRVREQDGVRCLLFVDANGEERLQSAVDLTAPEQLQLAYSKTLFASLLFCHPQDRVLIVGLGGGGMVRFLNHVFPETLVEAVEIDPAVVGIAASQFGTAPGPRTRIHPQDAFVFLSQAQSPFDAIYMDAFLRPAAGSGLDSLTSRLKTVAFLQDIRKQLAPGGVVAFNLIEADSSTPDDLEAIRAAFPSVYLFNVPGTGNLIAIGTLDSTRLARAELLAAAGKLEARDAAGGLPFRQFVQALKPGDK